MTEDQAGTSWIAVTAYRHDGPAVKPDVANRDWVGDGPARGDGIRQRPCPATRDGGLSGFCFYVIGEISQSRESGDVFRFDRNAERCGGQLDERDCVHRGHAGIGEPEFEVRCAAGIEVVATELQQAVSS